VADITVVIPVGPEPHHQQFLQEAIDSARDPRGALPVHWPLVIDDMAGLGWQGKKRKVRIIENSWRLGVGASFNVGIAEAGAPNVLMLGADDYLSPDCIEIASKEIDRIGDPLGYYYLPIEYVGDWETQTSEKRAHVPNNCAIVTKELWKLTGGFPPEACEKPDTVFVSMMMRHHSEHLHAIGSIDHPLYFHRVHPGQETKRSAEYWPAIEIIRDTFPRVWKRPEWGRYS